MLMQHLQLNSARSWQRTAGCSPQRVVPLSQVVGPALYPEAAADDWCQNRTHGYVRLGLVFLRHPLGTTIKKDMVVCLTRALVMGLAFPGRALASAPLTNIPH